MEGNWKDPELEGIYVKRCKCGNRPQYDRIDPCRNAGSWITCLCGKEGLSGSTKQDAVDNWNVGKLIYAHNMIDFKLIYPKKWDE